MKLQRTKARVAEVVAVIALVALLALWVGVVGTFELPPLVSLGVGLAPCVALYILGAVWDDWRAAKRRDG